MAALSRKVHGVSKQGRRQGRASPGPAALGSPFLAGPTNPGPAGPRVSWPCRVRAGPRALGDFKRHIKYSIGPIRLLKTTVQILIFDLCIAIYFPKHPIIFTILE